MQSHRRLADDASLSGLDCSKRIDRSCHNGEYSKVTCVARNILQLVRSCHIEFALESEHYDNYMEYVLSEGRWKVWTCFDMACYSSFWLRLCHVVSAS